MELTFGALLACVLLFALLAIFGVVVPRGPSDVALVFLLMFCLFYGLRPLLFVLGLDVPQPEGYFDPTSTSAALTATALGLALFLGMVLLGATVILRSGLEGWAPFFLRRGVDLRRATILTLALTFLATLISAWLLIRFGGFGQVVTAAKYDKALAGLYVLRVVPAVGAIVAVATFLEAHALRASRSLQMLALACSIANALSVFLWGSRSVLVIVGATIVLGLRRRTTGGDDVGESRRPVVTRLLVATLLVVAVAGGLRMARDQLINGEVQDVYADANTWRQVSLGTNAVYFDAAMLSFRDWPANQEFRNGEDFRVGILGVVPRAVWSGKPDAVSPGRWFRQVYQPDKVNGWPMGAAGVWYLNYGWWGLMTGGLLTGLAVGSVAAAQRRRPDHGFNTGVAITVGVYVIGLGVDTDTLVRCVIWLVPLWLAGRFLVIPDKSDNVSAESLGWTIPAARDLDEA